MYKLLIFSVELLCTTWGHFAYHWFKNLHITRHSHLCLCRLVETHVKTETSVCDASHCMMWQTAVLCGSFHTTHINLTLSKNVDYTVCKQSMCEHGRIYHFKTGLTTVFCCSVNVASVSFLLSRVQTKCSGRSQWIVAKMEVSSGDLSSLCRCWSQDVRSASPYTTRPCSSLPLSLPPSLSQPLRAPLSLLRAETGSELYRNRQLCETDLIMVL